MDKAVKKELYQLLNYEPGIATAIEEALVEDTFDGSWPQACAYGTAVEYLNGFDPLSPRDYLTLRTLLTGIEPIVNYTPLETYVGHIHTHHGFEEDEDEALMRRDLLKAIRAWRKKNEPVLEAR